MFLVNRLYLVKSYAKLRVFLYPDSYTDCSEIIKFSTSLNSGCHTGGKHWRREKKKIKWTGRVNLSQWRVVTCCDLTVPTGHCVVARLGGGGRCWLAAHWTVTGGGEMGGRTDRDRAPPHQLGLIKPQATVQSCHPAIYYYYYYCYYFIINFLAESEFFLKLLCIE